MLIAASADLSGELEVELPDERENAETADIFEQLRIDREHHPAAPLLRVEWE